jgi:hypothetical protein
MPNVPPLRAPPPPAAPPPRRPAAPPPRRPAAPPPSPARSRLSRPGRPTSRSLHPACAGLPVAPAPATRRLPALPSRPPSLPALARLPWSPGCLAAAAAAARPASGSPVISLDTLASSVLPGRRSRRRETALSRRSSALETRFHDVPMRPSRSLARKCRCCRDPCGSRGGNPDARGAVTRIARGRRPGSLAERLPGSRASKGVGVPPGTFFGTQCATDSAGRCPENWVRCATGYALGYSMCHGLRDGIKPGARGVGKVRAMQCEHPLPPRRGTRAVGARFCLRVVSW